MNDEYKVKNSEDKRTYGMRLEGFRSLSGIPDEFYSAEDPADREELWRRHLEREESFSKMPEDFYSAEDPADREELWKKHLREQR